MKIFTFFIFICFIIGCATRYQGTPDECRTDSCISQKKTEDFCNKIRQEGAFCVEFQISDFCVITGSKKQEIRTPCLDSLVFKEHDSLSIRFGYSGYMRFSNQETGNSIDFLVRYLGYSFRDAVKALAGYSEPVLNSRSVNQEIRDICIPEKAEPPFTRVFAYLTIQRGIPADLVRQLFHKHLLYQEKKTGNAVFINSVRDN